MSQITTSPYEPFCLDQQNWNVDPFLNELSNPPPLPCGKNSVTIYIPPQWKTPHVLVSEEPQILGKTMDMESEQEVYLKKNVDELVAKFNVANENYIDSIHKIAEDLNNELIEKNKKIKEMECEIINERERLKKIVIQYTNYMRNQPQMVDTFADCLIHSIDGY